MRTIVFYSYKGGAGRTLVLANVARYLRMFDQRVFLVDFDLEAPGLHHKLGVDGIQAGVVDYLLFVQEFGRAPDDLRSFVQQLPGETDDAESWLLPAGDSPSSSYMNRLSRLDWHRLFFGDQPLGIPAFLDLQARIETEYQPDFLLIDARTGITEIGGVATGFMADAVVALMLHNEENLSGTKMVLRAVADTHPDRAIPLVPVLSRVPPLVDRSHEVELAKRVQEYLNAPDAGEPRGELVDEVLILHSEPGLQLTERLLVGEENAADSVLLRDYLTLFSRVVPRNVLTPHIEKFVTRARDMSFDDPVGAQRDLETLARTTGHADAWRALIKFYGLRQSPEEMFTAALALWHLQHAEDDALLWQVVHRVLRQGPPGAVLRHLVDSRDALDFCMDVWRRVAPADGDVAQALLEALHRPNFARPAEAFDVALTHLEAAGTSDAAVLLAREYMRNRRPRDAYQLAGDWVTKQPDDPELLAVWARAAVACGPDEARAVVDANQFSAVLLAAHDRLTVARLFGAAGRRAEATDVVQEALLTAIRRDAPTFEFAELQDVYDELGASRDFVETLERNLGSDRANDVLQDIVQSGRRRRGGRTVRLA